MKKLLVLFFVSGGLGINAQTPDSISLEVKLEEVVVSVKTGINHNAQNKPASTVEEYLQTSGKVNMIKRGNYAWEPVINNMSSERISITIDGMKIFCACTDRMDPVTSYVETINLSKANLSSGFSGNPHASNNIGGSLDLKLNKAGFSNDGWDINLNTGYESNGNNQIYGTDFAWSGKTLYANSGVFYRHSDNYYAGGREKISFSQFQKTNVFVAAGYQPKRGRIVEAAIIYDLAQDVGYPALTMDVKSARGFISALSYRRENFSNIFSHWETKVYFNDISHIMDDTRRPDVAMHMDMPGKSSTGGVYSTLNGQRGRHKLIVNWDLYHNRSYAEMTMYPKNPDNPPMFMLTWPDIRTLNSGLALSDEISIDEQNTFRLSAKTSWQKSNIHDESGLHTLQVYYPDIHSSKNRLIWNLSGHYQHKTDRWDFSGGAGYGTRAPSVSEAYGYFLYNTFDSYDYIGNPNLKNESALELNISGGWKNRALNVSMDASAFYFTNYIIGKPDADLWRMTVGAAGVKSYQNLTDALMFNTSLSVRCRFLNYFQWKNRVAYSVGQDDNHNPLPLIAPLTGESSVSFSLYRFSAEMGVQVSGRQNNYSAEYGEDLTKDYWIANLSMGYKFRISQMVINLKAGIENLFDRNYSTYSDWNNISRKGRNIFINFAVNI